MTSRSIWWISVALGLYGSVVASAMDVNAGVRALYRTQSFKEVAISPDGTRVTWVEALKNADQTDSNNSAIYIGTVSSTGSVALTHLSGPNMYRSPLEPPPSEPARHITAAKGGQPAEESGFAWAPDSKQFAFLSDAGSPGQLQVYLGGTATEGVKCLTKLKGFLARLQFSPDGKQLAFLFTADAPRPAGPLQPSTPELGVVSQKIFEQRLTLIRMGDQQVREISPADTYVYEYDWAPDSREFVYSASKGEGDNNWWIAKLYRLSAEGGQPALLFTPPTQIADPHWSPDGKSVAFISGLMSDEGSTGGDIYTVGVADGGATNWTPGRKTSANWIHWNRLNGKLITGEFVDGGFAISALDKPGSSGETLWRGDEQIRSGGLADDGRTSALVRSSWERAPEVWAGPIGDWNAITSANRDLKPEWGKAEKLHWNSDGATVDGWLLYPIGFDPHARYPLIVSVHGGPASQKSPSWPSPGFDLSVLASQGYFVFYPNPRGSYGLGEAYTRGNVKDFGYGDLRDILTGLDTVEAKYPIDSTRVGVAGWSYGGYMTMWTVTQTHRFKAAVAGAGIANWESYYGQNLIDQWMIPYFGASVYDDPTVYAKSSPITYIKNATTPTLVVVGDSDAECPMPQSREFWHALKAQNVKTEFVIYPHEGHHFNKPEHVQDLMNRTIAWFNENLQANR